MSRSLHASSQEFIKPSSPTTLALLLCCPPLRYPPRIFHLCRTAHTTMAPVITITVDGSSTRNGYYSASAGFGVVISCGSRIVMEVQSALCPTCNEGMQTNNRAELRAAQWALHFLHEVAKLGSATHLCGANTVSDGRSICGSEVSARICTDSEWVVRGINGLNKVVAHEELWKEVKATYRCLTSSGMDVDVVHVRGHAGDRLNERADRFAKKAAQRGQEADSAWCRECGIEFGEGTREIEMHFKKKHLDRDLELEDEVFGTTYTCMFCPRQVKSEFSLMQHLRDKHGYVQQ